MKKRTTIYVIGTILVAGGVILFYLRTNEDRQGEPDRRLIAVFAALQEEGLDAAQIQGLERQILDEPRTQAEKKFSIAVFEFQKAEQIYLSDMLSPASRQAAKPHYQTALDQINDLMRMFPDQLFFRSARARCLSRLQRTNEAIQDTEILIKAQPKNLRALEFLADLLSVSGRNLESAETWALALATYQRTESNLIGRSASYYQGKQAVEYLKAGQEQKAIELLDKLKIDDRDTFENLISSKIFDNVRKRISDP
jgi:tetratricopeptide (TPR) repeat protein